MASAIRITAVLLILSSLIGCRENEARAVDAPLVRASAQPQDVITRPEDTGKKNRLYRTPRIVKVKCALPTIRQGDWGSMRRYLREATGCYDRVWARQFATMNATYTPPKREYLAKRIKVKACDGLTPPKGAYGVYCPASKTYYLLVERDTWSPDQSLWAAHLAAHEHSHYVQHLAGIEDYYDELYSRAATKKEELLAENRNEDQAGCFAAATLQAMRDELPSWSEFMAMYKTHRQIIAYGRWLERGYTGRLGSCNTWAAPKKDIG